MKSPSKFHPILLHSLVLLLLLIGGTTAGQIIDKGDEIDYANRTTTPPPSIPYSERLENRARLDSIIAQKIASIYPSQKVSTGEEINYIFTNPTISGTDPYFLEFEVSIFSNVNTTYLDNAPVFIQFNDSAFGTNLAARGKVTLTPGPLFDIPTYFNPAFNLRDQGADAFSTILSLNYAQSSWNRVAVDTFPIVLLNVKMEIEHCGIDPQVSFINQTNVSNTLLFADNPTEDGINGTFYLYSELIYGPDLPAETNPDSCQEIMISRGSGREQSTMINVFPNPATGQISVHFQLNTPQPLNISVINMVGKKVMDQNFGWLVVGTHLKQIDCSQLPDGLYFISTEMQGEFFLEKVMVR